MTKTSDGRRLHIRLRLLALLAWACAAGCLGLAGLVVALPWLARMLPGADAVRLEPGSAVVQIVLMGSAACVLTLLGIGSWQRQRWTRPLMTVLAWTWLLCGAVAVPYSLLLVEPLAIEAVPEPVETPEFIVTLRWIVGTAMTSIWIVVPAIFVLGFRSDAIRVVCEDTWPEPAWTDRCPPSVLTLAVGLGAVGYLAVPFAIQAVAPVFHVLVTGWPATLLILCGGAYCAWIARETYRCRRAGWWGTLVLMLLLGASSVASLLAIPTSDLYRALGYPEEQLAALERAGSLPAWVTVPLTLAITIACVIWLQRIRPFFREEPQ